MTSKIANFWIPQFVLSDIFRQFSLIKIEQKAIGKSNLQNLPKIIMRIH